MKPHRLCLSGPLLCLALTQADAVIAHLLDRTLLRLSQILYVQGTRLKCLNPSLILPLSQLDIMMHGRGFPPPHGGGFQGGPGGGFGGPPPFGGGRGGGMGGAFLCNICQQACLVARPLFPSFLTLHTHPFHAHILPPINTLTHTMSLQPGHKAEMCPNGQVDWIKRLGTEAFKMYPNRYWSEDPVNPANRRIVNEGKLAAQSREFAEQRLRAQGVDMTGPYSKLDFMTKPISIKRFVERPKSVSGYEHSTQPFLVSGIND